jgi:ribonuclease HII
VRSAAVDLEREWVLEAAGGGPVAGCDEVGRGAWAGPVTVGVVVVDPTAGPAPTGLADSKLLSASRRCALVPELRAWAAATGVGHAEAEEIDRDGLVVALGRAAVRALRQLGVRPRTVLLDGRHDWLTAALAEDEPPITVVTEVGADRLRASAAAASVLAKVARDDLMAFRGRRHPAYGWAQNKGYGTPDHRAALAASGPCAEHRRTWAPVRALSAASRAEP